MNTPRLLSIILLSFALVMGAGCKSGSHGHDQENVDKSGPEYTSAYVCPMHCPGSGASEPGKCSVCGMDMIKNPDYAEPAPAVEAVADSTAGDNTEEAGEYDHDHVGHDHE